MQRVVEPEILDSLSPDDPAAIASRRDILLYNRLMGNFRWFRKSLGHIPDPGRLIELGAGDGALGVYLLNHRILCLDSAYTAVDLIPPPGNWPATWHWKQTDLLCVELAGGTTLLANLILHQFGDEDLHRLGRAIRNSGIRNILINEPVRRPLHLWQISLSRLLRVHAVSLHDAQTSIRAGFRKGELLKLLGLDCNEWTTTECETFMGANRIMGARKS
jgi:hypothetical protein